MVRSANRANPFEASAPERRFEASRLVVRRAGGTDTFPDLRAMNRKMPVSFETQSYLAMANLDHGYFEYLPEAVGASDDHGFLVFPGQDQHRKASVLITGCLIGSRSYVRRSAAGKQEPRHESESAFPTIDRAPHRSSPSSFSVTLNQSTKPLTGLIAPFPALRAKLVLDADANFL